MSLQDDVVQLLRENGPMEVEFIRNRLCVASKARLEAALLLAAHDGRIERCNEYGAHVDGSKSYRLAGDTRILLAGDVHGLWRQRKRRALA